MGERTGKLEEIQKREEMDLETRNIKTDVETYNNKTPEEIRSQIENTRQQMGETIEEIQERLSISHITEQVKEEVSEQISDAWKATKESVLGATIDKTGEIMEYVNKGLDKVSDTKIGRAARENPIAFTLLGAGLGMLLYNAYQGSSSPYDKRYYSRSRRDYDNRYDRSERNYSSGTERTALEAAKAKAGNAYDSAADTAGSAYESASDTAGQVYDAAGKAVNRTYDAAGKAVSKTYDATGKTVSKTYDAAGNVVSSAYDTAAEVGSQVKDTAQELAHKAYKNYDYYIDENPLAVGAVALALGAAVGLSIPSTDFESNLMGETRDNLMQQAGEKVSSLIDTAEEKVDQVKTIAGKTIDKAVEEAKNAADRTAEKAKDEAKKENLA